MSLLSPLWSHSPWAVPGWSLPQAQSLPVPSSEPASARSCSQHRGLSLHTNLWAPKCHFQNASSDCSLRCTPFMQTLRCLPHQDSRAPGAACHQAGMHTPKRWQEQDVSPVLLLDKELVQVNTHTHLPQSKHVSIYDHTHTDKYLTWTEILLQVYTDCKQLNTYQNFTSSKFS